MTLSLCSSLCLFAAVQAGAPRDRLAVMPVQIDDGIKDEVPELINDYVLAAAQDAVAGAADVVGPDDINAMLSFEQQKEILGCDDTSCLADLAGALGVDRIVSYKVARVGDAWAVTSKLINIEAARVEARANDFVNGDVKALLRAMPGVTRKLFGQAPVFELTEKQRGEGAAQDQGDAPRKPVYKRWWFWVAIGGGALTLASVVLYAVWAADTLDTYAYYGQTAPLQPNQPHLLRWEF